MTRPYLLDVNVLVALFSPDSVHHEAAHDWFADHRGHGWATCPLTENGFIRVVSHPALAAATLRLTDVAARLKRFCASGDHVFWPDAISLRDPKLFNLALAAGHRQLTDIYLLGLAKRMGGRLATFDRTIPVGPVVGATRATLTIVAPADEPAGL